MTELNTIAVHGATSGTEKTFKLAYVAHCDECQWDGEPHEFVGDDELPAAYDATRADMDAHDAAQHTPEPEPEAVLPS